MGKLGVRLNLLNTGLSQVSGMELSSVCKIDGGYAVAGSEGLGVLGGDTDNTRNIDWKIVTPKHSLAIPSPKRIRKVYITGTATGSVKLTCENNDADSFNVTTSSMQDSYSATATINGRRSYPGTHWQFILESVNNSKAFIEYLGVLFIVLTRRRGI